MQAAVLTRYDAPFALMERPVPVPGPGEVLVAVGACGVCGSDRFLQQGGFGGDLPIVPGHEAAGTIAALGANVEGLEIGTRVAVYYLAHCGVCRYCREGRENICVKVRRMGVDFDGAMADYVAVPAENCLPLDPDFDLAAAAVITDAIGTPTHALRQSRIKAGDIVLVMGIGGIGSNAVQIAKLMGATVIGVSRSDAALANGRALGADYLLKSDDTLATAVGDVTRGLGVDAVIQCAPGETAFRAALPCLGRGGRLVIVGTSKTPIPVETNQMLWKEQELVGSRGFTRADIQQGLDWYRTGQIRVDHLVAHRRPLSQINEAIADLDNPDVVRTVIELAH